MPDSTQPRRAGNVSRRNFLAATTLGGTAAAFSLNAGKSATGRSPMRRQGKIRWRFEARRVEKTFSDGSTVPFFRYVAVGNSRSNGDLPRMQSRENRKLAVRIKNVVDFPIQPAILGYDQGPVIMPQETAVWNFTMPPAGTWIFTEALLGNLASSAGFAAAMISIPEKNTKPIRDYYLLYQNADDRWNNAIDNGNVPDESVYEPNFHTINGLSYPETAMDSATRINCLLGEDVRIRIANHSNIRQSIHLHGYHAEVLRRDNKPENSLPPKDTFGVMPNSTTELLLSVDQVGEYPVHPHSLTATTDNGLYQGGSVTMIDAQEI